MRSYRRQRSAGDWCLAQKAPTPPADGLRRLIDRDGRTDLDCGHAARFEDPGHRAGVFSFQEIAIAVFQGARSAYFE